ncbi:MAG: DegT/DnrJ/EryC1/StrS family aminotransferase, partial [Chloroflexi bacterium]|nr:DegT/DnrJ/EryC1/StrS family aminotransferase [Chloroflexota bacterium]
MARPRDVLYSERYGGLSDRLGGRLQLFAFGRQALSAALRSLGNGRILVPAYICDTVVDGIRAAGWQTRYYPLGEGLAPDWDWLEWNGVAGDRAMLLVHYFGFPSDLTRGTRFAEQHGLALIEDCAHAFLTAALNPEVGRTGHAAIYSWRKFLPVANGGALVERSNARPGNDQRPVPNGSAGAARELGKWLMFKSGSRSVLNRFAPSLSDERARIHDDAEMAAAPDRVAVRTLAAEVRNLAGIARKRRDNYRLLFDSLVDAQGVTLLTLPLADG